MGLRPGQEGLAEVLLGLGADFIGGFPWHILGWPQARRLLRAGDCIILSPVRKTGAKETFYLAGRPYEGWAPEVRKTTGATGRK